MVPKLENGYKGVDTTGQAVLCVGYLQYPTGPLQKRAIFEQNVEWRRKINGLTQN